MLKLIIRPHAKKDIKNIWHYTYENWGEQQAGKYTNELDQAITLLTENPNLGIDIDVIRTGYRMYHVNLHLIIYRLSSTEIDIVRVLGDKMEVERHVWKDK